jgi:hypothetical protein
MSSNDSIPFPQHTSTEDVDMFFIWRDRDEEAYVPDVGFPFLGPSKVGPT